jgi:predicted nucleic acid-binding protein
MTERPTLIDSNVLLDIALGDPEWSPWSRRALSDARERGAVAINPIVFAELAPAFASAAHLDAAMPPDQVMRLPLPFEAGWHAAQAFVRYRRSGGQRRSPLPDFYIGAHAQVASLTLLTRDEGRYRTYFPGLELIAPE